MEVKERFLLYRVCMPGDYLSIDQAEKGTVPVFPDRTAAAFTWLYYTVMTAKITLNLPLIQLFIKHRLFHKIMIPLYTLFCKGSFVYSLLLESRDKGLNHGKEAI